MPVSLDIILRLSPLVETLGIAFAATWVSVNQWRISREKLRLDLYNRRFDVYLSTLDYYQELLGWNDTPEQRALIKPFIKAVRESRFMFPKRSEVLAFLEEFQTHAFFIVQFKETRDAMQGTNVERMKLIHARVEHVNWILKSISTLEEKMAPYLSFEVL